MAAKLDIQEASVADIDRIVEIFMDAFVEGDDYFSTMFPPGGPGEAYMHLFYTNIIAPTEETKSQDVKVFTVKDENGVVQSVATFWTAKPEEGGIWGWSKRWPAPTAGVSGELLEEFFGGMESQHHQTMGSEAHTFLEILMTHSSHRKRGHGSALLSYLNGVADGQDHGLYLDAEKDAMGLYKKHGYAFQEQVVSSSPMSPMKRGKKSDREQLQ